jgi:ribosomal protein S27AE
MRPQASPMICPNCGAKMNHHAEKLVHPASPAEQAYVDPALDGILEELHTCPACGTGASRHVGPSSE